jgi:hypothetical protein
MQVSGHGPCGVEDSCLQDLRHWFAHLRREYDQLPHADQKDYSFYTSTILACEEAIMMGTAGSSSDGSKVRGAPFWSVVPDLNGSWCSSRHY